MAKSDRTGKRKPRGKSVRRVPDLGYYCIVTDTKETEENYLYGLRNSLPKNLQGRLVIKVSKAKTKNLVENCKSLVSLEPQYCEPWIVFDRDKVPCFDEIIQKAHKEGIRVGWSNPCIEIWLDAYFGKMHSYYDSITCNRRFAETYQRITGFEYDKSEEELYQILTRFGNENNAIKTAEARMLSYARNDVKKPSEMCPGTTMHLLVGEIRKKTGLSG